jgi:putative phage-type endonuclease
LGLRPGKEINSAMARGIENEAKARELIEEILGMKLPPARVFSEKHPFMMANFDGLSKDGKTAIEIKCPGKEDHELARIGKVPEKYYPQLQHLMIAIELPEIIYSSYKDNIIYPVPVLANKEYQKELLENERIFYEMLLNFKEPEKTERDYVARNDIAWNHKAKRYLQLKACFDDVENQLSEARQDLIFESNGNSSVGAGLKLIKSNRRGNIDYSKIEELKSIDLEKYRKPSLETWRIV